MADLNNSNRLPHNSLPQEPHWKQQNHQVSETKPAGVVNFRTVEKLVLRISHSLYTKYKKKVVGWENTFHRSKTRRSFNIYKLQESWCVISLLCRGVFFLLFVFCVAKWHIISIKVPFAILLRNRNCLWAVDGVGAWDSICFNNKVNLLFRPPAERPKCHPTIRSYSVVHKRCAQVSLWIV